MIKTVPWTGGTEEEYEAQLFGFGAQRFKSAVRQMVQQKISTCVKDMESYLQDSLNLNEKDHVVLMHSCDKLVRLYCERAGPSLEVIDEEIDRIMKIPSNVLLPEDEVQLNEVSDEDYEKLKDDVSALRKQVERGALMEALLSKEEEEIASIEKVCKIAMKDMKTMDLLFKRFEQDDAVKNIQGEVIFLCASAPFMKEKNNKNDDFLE